MKSTKSRIWEMTADETQVHGCVYDAVIDRDMMHYPRESFSSVTWKFKGKTVDPKDISITVVMDNDVYNDDQPD